MDPDGYTQTAAPSHPEGRSAPLDAPRERLLQVEDLTRHFSMSGPMPWSRRRGDVRAVDGVSFSIDVERTLSLVGESGCGKSTTARLVLGLDRPTSGRILFRDKDLTTLSRTERRRYRRGVQAVFQDPTSALNPRRRVRSIVGEPLLVNRRLHGSELTEEVDQLLTAVGLRPSHGDSFPHELSGGMRQRVAVAQALALRPSLIVLDEPVSALDVSIRAEIMNLLKDLQAQFGISYLLIAHDLATVRYLSNEVACMYLGQIVEHASAEAFFGQALHPYSLALMSVVASRPTTQVRPRIVLQGEIGSPAHPPSGCRSHPRCWLYESLGRPERCTAEAPPLRSLAPGHRVACHFAERLMPDGSARVQLLASAASSVRPLTLSAPAQPTG